MFPFHGWLLSDVSEMMDLCIKTGNNTTETVASFYYKMLQETKTGQRTCHFAVAY